MSVSLLSVLLLLLKSPVLQFYAAAGWVAVQG